MTNNEASPAAAAGSRFAALIENAPDAVVGVSAKGIIELVNHATETFFGWPREELIGQQLEVLIPDRFRSIHPRHRDAFMRESRPRPMGTGLELFGRRRDGSEFPIDVSLHRVDGGDGPLVLAFVRDITERKRLEQDARTLHEHRLARRQALDINDIVIQGLTTVMYSLANNDTPGAIAALEATMANARRMMSDLIGASDEPIEPGTLRRDRPAQVVSSRQSTASPASVAGRPRVVLADDTDDLRLLIRMSLTPAFDVVGEAADGRAAIELCARLQPDVILLDLSMPVVDGLEAIPEIRERSPGTKIAILSGYAAGQMEDIALAAGADRYVEKGTDLSLLHEVLHELTGTPVPAHAEPLVEPPADTAGSGDAPAISVFLHEIATPFTVIRLVTDTLRERIDELPSALVTELLDAMARNIGHVEALSASFSTAKRIAQQDVTLSREDTDLVALVRDAIADARTVTEGVFDLVSPADAHAFVDPVQVRQIVNNLLSNAAKFAPPGTPIRVSVETAPASVAIRVTNTGAPIPEADRQAIFDRFVRLNPVAPGLGIGLYIARGLAQAHGGTLFVEESDENATTFAVTLPRTAEP